MDMRLNAIFEQYIKMKQEDITIDQLIKITGDKIVIFGAGNLGISIVRALRANNIEPLCFCDNDVNKDNTSIENIKVIKPEQVNEMFGEVQFVICMYTKGDLYKAIQKQLVALGHSKILHIFSLRNCRELFNKVDNILPIGHENNIILEEKEKICELYGMLADEESRELLLATLAFRLLDIDFPIPARPPDEQYFSYDIYKQINNERFIDCGAYNGDTLLEFLKRNTQFELYLAFEPDEKNALSITKIIQDQDGSDKSVIKLFPYAVSNVKEKLYFENRGTNNSYISPLGETIIQCVDLDSYIYDQDITLIKMDVEGYETKALLGAKKTIMKQKPTLAISVYHKTHDLWEIPLLMKSMNPDYSIFLRSYNNLMEIIAYGVPKERII